MRLWYGFLIGLCIQLLMYKWGTLHVIAGTLFTYFFMKFFGRKYSAWYVLIFAISHLSFLHIYRMYTNFSGWGVDTSMIYMMCVCKFTTIAFCYEDGGKEEQDIKNKYHRDKYINITNFYKNLAKLSNALLYLKSFLM